MTFQESVEWCPRAIETMKVAGAAQGMAFYETLEQNTHETLVITETYAGAGNGSSVAAQLMGQFSSAPPPILFATWDTSQLSHKVVGNFKPAHAPWHMFGSVLDRLPEETFVECREIERRTLDTFRTLHARFKGTVDVVPTLSQEEFDAQKEVLSHEYVSNLNTILSSTRFSEEVFCYVCERNCPASPRLDARLQGARWIDIGGCICNPWSNLNQQNLDIFHEATLVALTWMHSNRYYQPDDVIAECVPHFKMGLFIEILNMNGDHNITGFSTSSTLSTTDASQKRKRHLQQPTVHCSAPNSGAGGGSYKMFELRFSPVDLGIPVARQRVYAWFRNIGTTSSLFDGKGNPHHCFADIFFRKCIGNASMFLLVSDEVRQAHKLAWQQRRADVVSLDTDEEDNAFASRAVVDGFGPFGYSSLKMRLEDFKHKAEKVGMRDDVHIQNLFNNAGFIFNKTNMVPTLLQHSLLYDLKTSQEILPIEHLMMQGFPVPGYCTEECSRHFPFPVIVSDRPHAGDEFLSDKEIRSLAGIGFHWSQIGAFVTWVMCTSKFLPVVLASSSRLPVVDNPHQSTDDEHSADTDTMYIADSPDVEMNGVD